LTKIMHRLSRLIKNAAFDLRYGGFLGGRQATSHADLGAAWVVSTDYAVMSQIFEGRVRDTDVLVEVGCGKGRVINWWLDRGYKNKIVGVELEEDVAAKTRKRLKRYENVHIVSGNVVEKLPNDGTLFYLFNPFTDALMGQFKDALWRTFKDRGNVTLLYYAPLYIRPFEGDSNWEVEEVMLDLSGVAGNHLDRHQRLAVIRMKSGT
jgi:SAM-dependent methyltransferase